MEYLQYLSDDYLNDYKYNGFKPYYKWNTFNTERKAEILKEMALGFKPYYKWNTFNTKIPISIKIKILISFKPYYKWNTFNTFFKFKKRSSKKRL